jgi:hypothetical protein
MESNNTFNGSISGLWKGETTDEFHAIFEMELFQKDNFIEGDMKITEQNHGFLECSLNGEIRSNKIVKLKSEYQVLGFIPVSGTFYGELVAKDEIKGKWNSGMGHNGSVTIRRFNSISK